MKKKTWLGLGGGLLVSIGIALGCGTGGSSSTPSASLADFQSRASAIRQKTSAHGSDIAGATSLSQVRTFEAQYWSWMSGEYGAMGQDMSAMMAACGSSMMMGLSGAYQTMEQECDAHRAIMESAGTMGAARGDEDLHQQGMTALLNSMDGICQSMTPMMGGCSGGQMGMGGMH